MTESFKQQQEDQAARALELEKVFLAEELIPNAAESFLHPIPALEDAIKTADIVLDTNVLFRPYREGGENFKELIDVFRGLRAEQRLFLPAQAAREFIRHRPQVLGELQKQMSDKIRQYVSIKALNLPALEEMEEYLQLNETIEKTENLAKDLAKAGDSLLQSLRSWEWNDPINLAYSKLFGADNILELPINREQALAELKRRHTHRIPPGYLDNSKETLNIGDFLIWMTILELGGKNKKPLVFVTLDQKSDWQQRSNGNGFLPRFELQDEYRRKSGGKSFYAVAPRKLLELLSEKILSIDSSEQK
jgi:predicted nucleic acid-binding protein